MLDCPVCGCELIGEECPNNRCNLNINLANLEARVKARNPQFSAAEVRELTQKIFVSAANRAMTLEGGSTEGGKDESR